MLKDFLKELSFKDKADFAELMLEILPQEEKEKIFSEMGISEEEFRCSINEVKKIKEDVPSGAVSKMYQLSDKAKSLRSGSLPQFLDFAASFYAKVVSPFVELSIFEGDTFSLLKPYRDRAKRKYGEITPQNIVKIILEDKDKNDTCLLSENNKDISFYVTLQTSVFLSTLALYVYHLPEESFEKVVLHEV